MPLPISNACSADRGETRSHRHTSSKVLGRATGPGLRSRVTSTFADLLEVLWLTRNPLTHIDNNPGRAGFVSSLPVSAHF